MPAYTLRISDMKFFAFHGFYAEEQKTGTWFSVSVDLEINTEGKKVEDLGKTVNYEKVHSVVHEIMQNPQQLIESVCHDIYQSVRSLSKAASKVKVIVEKLTPPLKNTGKTSFEISDFVS